MASGRLVVVSPHLDDAVFACADLIARHPGAMVITIFAGAPKTWGEPTDWDAASGFASGENAVARRRKEDREALSVLGATPLWLPFLDRQYGGSADSSEITAALDTALAVAQPDIVAIPLGLWHSDHGLAHQAAIALIPRRPHVRWLAYEDAIYRRFRDSGLAERAHDLHAFGIMTDPLPPGEPASPVKRLSIGCYRSQLRALTGEGRPGWVDALAPERYWALHVMSAEA